MTSDDERLADWVREQIGDDRHFKSARDWSVKAGLNPNAVNDLLRRGKAGTQTLRAIAEARGVSLGYVYVRAGILDEADLITPLAEIELAEEIVEAVKRVPIHLRRAVLRVALELSAQPDS